MKKLLPILTAILIATPFALHAADTTPKEKPADKSAGSPAKVGKFKWYTSIKAARKAAATEKKPVFMLFTGSDWCPYCVKLEKEILSKKEFKDWAKGNAILFIADSKGGRDKLSAENLKLKNDFGVNGYPTVILTDAEGKKFGQTGYIGGTPADYCKMLDGIIANAPKH